MVYPFLEKEHIFSLCSNFSQSSVLQISDKKKAQDKKKDQLHCNQQPVFILDHRKQLHRLNYDVGKFKPKFLSVPVI